MNLTTLRVLACSDPNVFAEAVKKYGLRVIGLQNHDPLESRVQSESISAMASALTEDVDDPVDINPWVAQVIQIAEENGYIVELVENVDAPPKPPPMKPPMKPQRPAEKPGPPAPPPHKPPPAPKRRKALNPPRPKRVPKPKAMENPGSMDMPME